MVRTLAADYRYRDKVDAVADIYVTKDAEGARKIFEFESAAGSKPVALGQEGRLYGASLTFRKGPYFVRLVAYQQDPRIAEALVELARGIEKKLVP